MVRTRMLVCLQVHVQDRRLSLPLLPATLARAATAGAACAALAATTGQL
jgi:hypothetical protein